MNRTNSENQSKESIAEFFNNDKKIRIEWLDVFKGILILLVVIGHATGIFNGWIYQFHMAAFFFASGFLSNIEKRNGWTLILKKINVLFIPLISLSIGALVINSIINRIGLYELLFGSSFGGVINGIKDVLVHGIQPVQYLGALWFLVALLGIELFQFFLFHLTGKKNNWVYWTVCVGAFFVGYWLILNGITFNVWIFPIDLIFIGQGYYSFGLFLKKIHIREYIDSENSVGLIALTFVAVLVVVWGKMNGITVDYPSRRLVHPFAEFFVAIANIYLIYIISRSLAKRTKVVKRVLVSLGKNSLGIMALHFAFFKLYMLMLYCLGKATGNQIINVVLPTELKTIKYWLPMALVSVIGSWGMWVLLGRCKIIAMLIGKDLSICNYIVEKTKGRCMLNTKFRRIGDAMVLSQKQINKHVREAKKIILLLGIIVVLFAIPMYRTGIILNDELQARCLSMTGFVNFFKTEFIGWVAQGRLLAAPVNSVTKYLSFIGPKTDTSFRVGTIIILLGVVISFSVFLYKLFKNKWFAIFAGVFALSCMPIGFEHTPPNAFVGFIASAFMFVLISNSLYVVYIESQKTFYAISSMGLFFVAMMSYEAFVTYVLLYLCVVCGKTGIKNIKNSIKLYLIPVSTAVIFLICYIFSSKLAPSGYVGNQIGIDSIFEPIRIVIELAIASFPGFFVVFPRYQYFKQLYFNLNIIDYVRIVLFGIVFTNLSVIILEKLVIKKTDIDNGDCSRRTCLKNCLVILTGMAYTMIPSVPNAISKMYQENAGFAQGFLTLPVTFMEYFAASFVVCFAIWKIVGRVGKKYYYVVSILLCVLVINIQEMNDIFSKQQNSEYEELIETEFFMNTEVFAKLKPGMYYASDLHTQKNLLVIHNGYWSSYCNDVLGINIQLASEHNDTEIGSIFYDGDNYVIVDNERVIIVSKDQEIKSKAVQVDDEEYRLIDFSDEDAVYREDHNYYVYTVLKEDFSFSKSLHKPLTGVWHDGWLETTSTFAISTGKQGKIQGQLFYPGVEFEGKQIEILFDGELIQTIDVQNEIVEFDVYVGNEIEGILSLNCNFEFEEIDTSDTRNLAIVLSNMNVQ